MKCPNCKNTTKFTLEFAMHRALSVDFEVDDAPDVEEIEERLFVDIEDYEPVPTGWIQCEECHLDDTFHPKGKGLYDWGDLPEAWKKEYGL